MRLRSVLGLCCAVWCSPWPASSRLPMRLIAGFGCSTRLPAPRPRVVAAFLAAWLREVEVPFFLLLLLVLLLLLLLFFLELAAADAEAFFFLLDDDDVAAGDFFARLGLRLVLAERFFLLLAGLLLALRPLLLLALLLLLLALLDDDELRDAGDERVLLRPRLRPDEEEAAEADGPML